MADGSRDEGGPRRYQFDFAAREEYWPEFLRGALTTLEIMAVATVLGLVIGILCAIGRRSPSRVRQRLRQALPDILAQRTDALTPRMTRLMEGLLPDWHHLDECIEAVTEEIQTLVAADEACQRLMSVPGWDRSSLAPWWPASAMEPRLAEGVISALGSGWCRSRRQRVTARS